MKHYLIIPFNAGCKDEGWLERRLALFRAFSIPSINAQTVQDFTTVLMIDPDTPDVIKKELKQKLDCVLYETESWWCVERGDVIEAYSPEFSAFLRSLYVRDDWIITSRLDSDDAFANNYIEVTQGLFRKKEEFMIYPNGVIWTSANKASFIKKAKSPPFSSLVEPGHILPKTVFYMSHGHVPLLAPYQSYDSELMWIHTHHGENLAGSPKNLDRRLSREEVFERFTVDPEWIM